MTDYSKLKVAELKEQLNERGLLTTGKKDDLVSRLVADDAAKATNPTNGENSSESVKEAVPAPAPAPSATETPVEKKEIKTDTTIAPQESTPNPTATAPIEGEKKKFAFKRLADEFDTSAPKTPEPPKPEEPKAPEPAESFAAGLASTNTDSELEKRKKRAARFGVPVAESIKLTERAKRFATDGNDDASKDTTIKALDSALGENRGKKRAPETRIQNEPKKSKDSSKPTTKSILTDPSEKAKAEARAKRFG